MLLRQFWNSTVSLQYRVCTTAQLQRNIFITLNFQFNFHIRNHFHIKRVGNFKMANVTHATFQRMELQHAKAFQNFCRIGFTKMNIFRMWDDLTFDSKVDFSSKIISPTPVNDASLYNPEMKHLLCISVNSWLNHHHLNSSIANMYAK